LSLSNSLEGAGKALVEGKLEKAAEQLEQLEDPQLERKEAKAVEDKLKKAAQDAADVGLGSLSEAATEMAEGLKGGKGHQFKKGANQLAKEARKQDRLKKINNLLQSEFDKLTEGKCNCQSNSLAKGKRPEKSLSPSSIFGMGTSGNYQGEKTSMLAQ